MRISTARFGLTAAAVAAALVAPAGHAGDPVTPPGPPAPREGCATFTDAKGDGTIGASLPDDPDLDIVRVVLASPPDKVRAYVQVAELTTPSFAPGHQFVVSFLLDSKPVTLYASRHDPGTVEEVHNAGTGAGALKAMNGVTHNGVLLKDAKIDVVWDEKAHMVVLTADRAPIEAVAKVPLSDGTVVKTVTAKSAGHYLYSTVGADTATGATPEAAEYTFGQNPCFAPPEGKITLHVPPSVTAGHIATVQGTLATVAGAGMAGKKVVVSSAGRTEEATTAADGSFAVGVSVKAAGTQPVTVTWAGDDTLAAATGSANLLAKVQPTTTALTAALSGTTVTVKATLLDDLRKPVAGQTITWLVDGKAAGSTRTDSAGRASLRTVKGKTVKATFAGVRNRYAASTASRRT